VAIVGIGLDIVEQSRISDIYERFGERFLKRILCKAEISYCLRRVDPFP